MTLAMPIALRRVIDFGIMSDSIAAISRHFWVLLVLGALLAIFSSLRFFLVSWIGERVVADLRSAIFSHVLSLTPSYFEENRTGEILSRITTDTTLIQNVVGSSVSIALRSAATLIGGLIMLMASSFKLAAIILLLLPMVVAPVLIIGRRIRGLSRQSQDRIADTSAVAGEILNAIEITQAFSLENLKKKKFNLAVEESFRAAKRRINSRALLTGLAMLSIFSAIVGVLWIGTLDVFHGKMSGGQLGQFLLYAIIVGGSTTMIGEIWGSLQQAAGATERIIELLSTTPRILAPLNPVAFPESVRGDIEFRSVSFSYPSRQNTFALDNFSLAIPAGESVALVGPSGAGKSTVFQLLLNFYRPDSGSITLDNVDLISADPLQWRKYFAIVPQNTVLFAGNLLENIRLGDPSASDDAVIEAAVKASADEFISRLPDGYQTVIGERGARLSGGQKQRIAIARAILKSPAVLLLDEATSALDSENEALIQDSLKLLSRQCTTIVIAHRLSTVVDADRIIVMEQGKIVAAGTHEELSAKQGTYARLVALQTGATLGEINAVVSNTA